MEVCFRPCLLTILEADARTLGCCLVTPVVACTGPAAGWCEPRTNDYRPLMERLQGVATAEDIDTAMEKGSRLYKGPLKLADYVGVPLSASRATFVGNISGYNTRQANKYLCGPAAFHCSYPLILPCCLAFPSHHVPASSEISLLLGLFSGCSTQQTETFVDRPRPLLTAFPFPCP